MHLFNVRGERQPPPCSLGAACEAAGVEAAAVFRDGLAVLTPTGQLWCVPDIHSPRLQRFPDPAPGLAAAGAGSGVHCMAALPPLASSSGALEVLVAVEETVRVLDASEALPTSVFEGPILRRGLLEWRWWREAEGCGTRQRAALP